MPPYVGGMSDTVKQLIVGAPGAPAAPPANGAIIPEFIRLPKPRANCPWSGLTRSGLNEIILPTPRNGFKPQVKSFALRHRGAARGVRLIVLDSLLGYLRAVAAEQNAIAAPAPGAEIA